MIVAKASNIALQEIGTVDKDTEARLISNLAELGLTLTYPCLETNEGDLITESPAICQFLAASGSAPHLRGETALEQAQVDQWMQFLKSQTLGLAKALSGAVYGTIDMSADEHAYITSLLKENLKTLNNALKAKLWMCGGDKPTFADYFLVICTAELMQCVMDTNIRNSLNNLNAHFKKVAVLDEVKGRLGNLK